MAISIQDGAQAIERLLAFRGRHTLNILQLPPLGNSPTGAKFNYSGPVSTA
jgi:hypothetical protein